MVILKFGQIIDILIDNDVKVIALVMRRDVGLGERLRHLWVQICSVGCILRKVIKIEKGECDVEEKSNQGKDGIMSNTTTTGSTGNFKNPLKELTRSKEAGVSQVLLSIANYMYVPRKVLLDSPIHALHNMYLHYGSKYLLLVSRVS